MAPQMSDENNKALLLEAHVRFLRLYEDAVVERKPPSSDPGPAGTMAIVRRTA